jgi:hypothetical protein
VDNQYFPQHGYTQKVHRKFTKDAQKMHSTYTEDAQHLLEAAFYTTSSMGSQYLEPSSVNQLKISMSV